MIRLRPGKRSKFGRYTVAFRVISTVLAILAVACSQPVAEPSLPVAPTLALAEEPGIPAPEPTVALPEPTPEDATPEDSPEGASPDDSLGGASPDQTPETATPDEPTVVDEHEPHAMPLTPPVAPEDPAAAFEPVVCEDRELPPLPPPGTPGTQGLWGSFREPLPPAPVWNPPGPKRVGLQAGHWLTNEVPRELSRLAGGGTSDGGYAEWEVNLDIAQRTAAILEGYGVEVDILPATVPPSYQAHVFLAIHADGDVTGALRGFKVARPAFSSVPEEDDVLVEALNEEYGPATGLRRDAPHISRRMLYYYAFNSRRYCHSVAPGVPSAIFETGFLTNVADRRVLIQEADSVALGIARGLLRYLGLLER